MTAARFLADLDRMGDAPAAVPQLRRLILELAVRGTLMDQLPGDGTAAELLRSIRADKARLIAEGAVQRDKALPAVTDAPFALPGSWQWVRLQEITSLIQRGKSPKYAEADGLPVISQRCVRWDGLDLTVAKLVDPDSLVDYAPGRFLRDGDLLWNSTGTGTIGRVARMNLATDNLVCDSHVTVIRCLGAEPEYVRMWLRSDHVYGRIEERASGSTKQVELTLRMATNQLVPLPPLPEQRRIVAKVAELMELCDELDAAQSEQESWRERLMGASLYRLRLPVGGRAERQGYIRFHLNHLPRMVTRAEHVQPLREAIVDLAVSGQLVPHKEDDEAASELLQRIAASDGKVAKRGTRGGPKQLPVIQREEAPYPLPEDWVWARLAALCRQIHYGFTASADVSRKDVRLLRITDIQDNRVDWESVPGCDIAERQLAQYRLEDGDILVARTGGTIGKTFLVKQIPVTAVFASYLIRIQGSKELDDRYLKLFLESSSYWQQLQAGSRGTGQPNVNGQTLGKMAVAVPPRAEQQRIVAKVAELMTLCDELDRSLTAVRVERGQLLEASVREVLTEAA